MTILFSILIAVPATVGLFYMISENLWLGIVCYIVFFIGYTGLHKRIIPTALDVYRGKTELRITSVNGVPTDTTVVYKVK